MYEFNHSQPEFSFDIDQETLRSLHSTLSSLLLETGERSIDPGVFQAEGYPEPQQFTVPLPDEVVNAALLAAGEADRPVTDAFVSLTTPKLIDPDDDPTDVIGHCVYIHAETQLPTSDGKPIGETIIYMLTERGDTIEAERDTQYSGPDGRLISPNNLERSTLRTIDGAFDEERAREVVADVLALQRPLDTDDVTNLESIIRYLETLTPSEASR